MERGRMITAGFFTVICAITAYAMWGNV
jgi:hypothetical protein